MLLHEFYPDDIRVSKEVKSLSQAGYNIHLLCLQRRGEQATDKVNDITVHRIPIAQSFFWRGIWDILLAFRFFQPIFFRHLKQLQKQFEFEAIHVHDLPLAGTALKAKSKFKKPKVILDFHENYPEALKVWFKWKKNPIIRFKNRIFFGFERWLAYEGKACKAADHIMVVVDEMKNRLVSEHHIDEKKISVVTNSESREFLNQEKLDNIYNRTENEFILAYTGWVGPHRGVDVAVKSLAYLKNKTNLKLVITGSVTADSKSWLQDLIKDTGVGEQVVINGYQPFHKFFSYMADADVNLIPHNRNGHTDNTIPHKLFQGMMVGKPVLVSDAPPLKRVIEATQSGLVFEAGNPKDFANKVELLYEDQEEYLRLGVNGKKATTEGTYNWEHTGQYLVEVYNALFKA